MKIDGGGAYSRIACLTVAETLLTTRPLGDGALFSQKRVADVPNALLYFLLELAKKAFVLSMSTPTLAWSNAFSANP